MSPRISRTMLTSGVAIAIGCGVAAAPASAKDTDVIREGNCSGATDWKLKLSEEDGALEVEYEIDQNRSGDTWSVAIGRNGNRVFNGTRQTGGRSGSFEVRVVISDAPGVADQVKGRAINQRTGEVCRGVATSDF